MEPSSVVNRDQVQQWITALQTRLSELERNSEQLERERIELERQLALLSELLERKAVERAPADDVSHRFRDALQAILHESHEPMHLVEIRNALNERGVEVPGQGADANIIAHLRRLPGIYRVSRGTYSSKPEVISAEVAPRRKRRRKRRKAFRKSDEVISTQA